MRFPDKAIVDRVRTAYPPGARVELLQMDDAQAPSPGTLGTVIAVDDAANLIMKWDNGSGLNVVYGVDRVRRIGSSFVMRKGR